VSVETGKSEDAVTDALDLSVAGEHFDRVVGLEYDEIGSDRVTGRVVVDERHHQPTGVVHGGVYTTVVESLASYGAALWAYENLGGQIAVGLSNTTDFLRAHRSGTLRAVAEPVHRGRSQQLWQVTISRESDGKSVARGQVRLQNVTLDELAGRG
jgi:1,4-dihydroxy-2-naphthoyl-CoA hydrolase